MVKKSVLDEKIRQKILDFAELLRANGIRVDRLILYGSHAKGTPRLGSDIDLCVVSSLFSSPAAKEKYFRKIWHLAAKTDTSLEPVPLSPDDLKDKYSTLIEEINRYGVEIRTGGVK